MLKINKLSLRLIILAVIVLVIAIYCVIISSNNRPNSKAKLENTKISYNTILIPNRQKLINNNKIYFGNNLKELENNFFDICIEKSNNILVIWLNKLWVNDYDEDFIDDNYLAQISRGIDDYISFTNKPEDFEYVIFKYIKDNYIEVREKGVDSSLDLGSCKLKGKLINNMFRFEIEVF